MFNLPYKVVKKFFKSASPEARRKFIEKWGIE